MPSNHPDTEKLRQDLQFDTRLRGHDLRFRATWGVFSPRSVDDGSRMLLDHVEVAPDFDCLDLGCGYGVLGITLARMAPEGQTLLLDKDYVAIDYARTNIALNRVDNARAELSNGFSVLRDQKFDLIVSNIPAKVGNEMLSLFLHDAWHHLKPGGRFVVVTITGLRKFMQRNFKDVFGNYKKHKQGPAYTVASATRMPAS